MFGRCILAVYVGLIVAQENRHSQERPAEPEETDEDYADEYGGTASSEPDPWGISTCKSSNGVLDMDDRSFGNVFDSYDHVFVQFYAPWCWHSQDLDTRFFEAARLSLAEPTFKDTPVVFAKMDRTLPWYAEFMMWWSIPPTTPVVKFFYKGVPLDVPAPVLKSADAMFAFAKKTAKFSFPEITTSKEANAIAKSNPFVVFSVWDKIDGNSAITDCLARAAFGGGNEDVPFPVTTSPELMKKFKVTAPAVVILRKFDEPRKIVITAEKLTSEYCQGIRSLDEAVSLWTKDISALVAEYKIPTMIEFDGGKSVDLLNDKFPRLFQQVMWIFVDKDSGFVPQVKRAVAAHARTRKDTQLTFIVTNRKLIAHMMGHFKITNKPPLAMMAKFNSERSKQDQYLLVDAGREPETFTEAALDVALQKYDDGTLAQHFRSEKPKNNQMGPLKSIVALEWENRVVRPQKDVLVLFTHHTTCKASGTACADVTKQVKEVAARLQHVPSVSVLTIDMQDNEVDIKFLNRATVFPILTLFPATSKDDHVNFAWKTGLNGATAEMMIKALSVNAHISFEYEESKAEL